MFITILLALSLQATQAEAQANNAQMSDAVEGMTKIFTELGACERHYTPQQVQGIRAALEPEAGQAPNALQQHLERAYQQGKLDTSKSAAYCRAVYNAVAQAQQEAPNQNGRNN